MKDKELRKLIGSRAKQRRLELNLTQPYVAEKMGVTASTILRYENGSIDNTKKMGARKTFQHHLFGIVNRTILITQDCGSGNSHLLCNIRLCQI